MGNRTARRLEDAMPRTGSTYPEPFRAAVADRTKWPMGDLFGLDQFGVNVVELAPGAASAQRHWHSAEDEFVYVLDGPLVLVTDGGEEPLSPGDFVGFKAGVENGHCLVNRTHRPVRYLEVGSRRVEVDSVCYPDIDLAIEADGSARRRYRHKDGMPY